MDLFCLFSLYEKQSLSRDITNKLLQGKFRTKMTEEYCLMYSQRTECPLLFYFHPCFSRIGKEGVAKSQSIPSVFCCSVQGAVGLCFPSRLRICQNSCVVNIFANFCIDLTFSEVSS